MGAKCVLIIIVLIDLCGRAERSLTPTNLLVKLLDQTSLAVQFKSDFKLA